MFLNIFATSLDFTVFARLRYFLKVICVTFLYIYLEKFFVYYVKLISFFLLSSSFFSGNLYVCLPIFFFCFLYASLPIYCCFIGSLHKGNMTYYNSFMGSLSSLIFMFPGIRYLYPFWLMVITREGWTWNTASILDGSLNVTRIWRYMMVYHFGFPIDTITVCPRSSVPFYTVTYYIEWGHFFLDITVNHAKTEVIQK